MEPPSLDGDRLSTANLEMKHIKGILYSHKISTRLSSNE